MRHSGPRAGQERTFVIPAQAGIHSCACPRSSCRDLGRPAPRQALPGSRVGCAGERPCAGAAWRSTLVAAKTRAPRPQRFTGAGGAAPDCPAMLGLAAASRNSLRSLRSLRSDNRDESVDESRCARGRKPCASRRTRGALRPGRTRLCGYGVGIRAVGARKPEHHQRSVAPGAARRGRSLGRRGAQPTGRRAQRASSSFSSRLSERRERSERSEFRDATPGRAPQGSRRVQRRPPQCELSLGSDWYDAGKPRSRRDERRHAQLWIPACAGMTTSSCRTASSQKRVLPGDARYARCRAITAPSVHPLPPRRYAHTIPTVAFTLRVTPPVAPNHGAAPGWRNAHGKTCAAPGR